MKAALASLVPALLLAACDDMSFQPKQKNYSPLMSPAATPENTTQFQEAQVMAPPVTPALLERGQERYRIYCVPCHSELGDGDGIVVRRGFAHPPSFHDRQMREAPVQHFYDVITLGVGDMFSFAARVEPKDRWAIAAYIRALQFSQNANAADLALVEKERRP